MNLSYESGPLGSLELGLGRIGAGFHFLGLVLGWEETRQHGRAPFLPMDSICILLERVLLW